MSYLKAIFAGLIIGLTLSGIWNLQEANYYLGTIVGLGVLILGLVIVSKKGN